MSSARHDAADAFRRNIRRSNEIHEQYLSDPALMRDYERFTHWQLEYLLAHFPALRDAPGYREALNFVVADLAGLSVSQRDRQLARAAPAVTGFLPLGALRTLADASRLNARTLEINVDICRNLRTDGELREPISEQDYFAASRQAASFEESIELLGLSMRLGRALVPTVNSRLIGLTLRAMHAPAHAAGFGDLQDFFENGYATFRDIPDVDHFLAEIEGTMTRIFERIYHRGSTG